MNDYPSASRPEPALELTLACPQELITLIADALAERLRGGDPGIEELDRRLLYALSEFFEGTAGVLRLAAAAEVGPEHALERLHGLAREGLVRAAGRAGWTITASGSLYLRRRAA